MADFYIPKDETFEKIKSLGQGFWLELDVSERPVLLLKLEASLSTSIVNGCPIEIFLRNPNIERRSCTVYIYDILKDPFWVTWNNIGKEDEIFKDFDEVAIKLVSSNKITLVLFNEFSHAFYTTELLLESEFQKFKEWLFHVTNFHEYKETEKSILDGHYFPEDEKKGFKIKIINRDNSKEDKLTIIAPEYQEPWRQNSSSSKETFSYNDYERDGKHGYFQELSITNNLSIYFRPEIDFFISPKCTNGNEFTDFIIAHGKAAILIESKYVISEKQTKKHSAITKAISQLKNAEELIKNKNTDLVDSKLTALLNNIEVIAKVCLVNDRLIMTKENSKAIIKHFPKEQLPMFISVSTFFQLVVSLKLKNKNLLIQNLIFNCVTLHDNYLKSDKDILYIRHFSIEGLSVEELNKLGSKKNDSSS